MKEYTRDIMTYREYLQFSENKELDAQVAFMSKQLNDSGQMLFTKLPKNLQSITKMKVS